MLTIIIIIFFLLLGVIDAIFKVWCYLLENLKIHHRNNIFYLDLMQKRQIATIIEK
jgi:hypothetical protein